MTTLDLIISLFCLVDDRIGHLPKHPRAKLYPSELVTIGLLPLCPQRLLLPRLLPLVEPGLL